MKPEDLSPAARDSIRLIRESRQRIDNAQWELVKAWKAIEDLARTVAVLEGQRMEAFLSPVPKV